MDKASSMSVTASSTPLIPGDDLASRLGTPGLRIFDVRGRWGSPPQALHDDYLAGHIPGAAFLDWTLEFLQQGVPINLAPVATAEEAATSFERLGISADDHVVLYDDYHHMMAGRVWWAMRYHGFRNVQVLNGGWAHWVGQDFPTAREEPDAVAGSFKPIVQDDMRMTVEGVIAGKDEACLLDGRGPVGYAGNPEDPRSGHIPGAINVPYSAMLDKTTGLFLPDDALTTVFDCEAPDWRTTQVISSCGSGYAGTVLMLAMAHLGVASALFDGSMAEWKQDPSREIAQSFRAD
ncbi:sulfurtransferase [Pelagibius sp. Alg239-R121]|uniref:sulfurtransferase n=1 Tax=Pelagibius sp. Alg239-R121 TaxID=2993448 RepID=UPI0024A78E57|nr:sulfurtransferase [Pelagibius sp. Alg239-R121]